MTLEKDLFVDHKPLCNNYCKLPKSAKVKKVKGKSKQDARAVGSMREASSNKGKFKGDIAAM